MHMEEKQSQIQYPTVDLKDVASFMWAGANKGRWALLIVLLGTVSAPVVAVIIPLYYKRFFDVLGAGGEGNDVVAQLVHILLIILA